MYGNVHWVYEEGMNSVWSKQIRNSPIPLFPLCDLLGQLQVEFSVQNSIIQFHHPLCGFYSYITLTM